MLAKDIIPIKEYFVLQKIAEVEKIDVDEDDLNDEIVRIADQSGESPRRVRARLEKEDMMEALMADMIERKALDLILDSAEYENVVLDQAEQTSGDMATVEVQAVPGEMLDPTAAPSEPAAPGGEDAGDHRDDGDQQRPEPQRAGAEHGTVDRKAGELRHTHLARAPQQAHRHPGGQADALLAQLSLIHISEPTRPY